MNKAIWSGKYLRLLQSSRKYSCLLSCCMCHFHLFQCCFTHAQTLVHNTSFMMAITFKNGWEFLSFLYVCKAHIVSYPSESSLPDSDHFHIIRNHFILGELDCCFQLTQFLLTSQQVNALEITPDKQMIAAAGIPLSWTSYSYSKCLQILHQGSSYLSSQRIIMMIMK